MEAYVAFMNAAAHSGEVLSVLSILCTIVTELVRALADGNILLLTAIVALTLAWIVAWIIGLAVLAAVSELLDFVVRAPRWLVRRCPARRSNGA